MDAHPAAALFPLLEGNDLDELAADIRENGLNQPIVLHEGLVLDGRNRLRACQQAGVDPQFVAWSGQGSTPLRYVVSQNLHRRHLSTSQRAAIAVEVMPTFEEEARKNLATSTGGAQARPLAERPKAAVHARDEAAALMNVGARTVGRAKQVKEEDPEVFERVKSGEMTVEEAHRTVGFNGSTRIRERERNGNGKPKTSQMPRRIGPRADERRMADFEHAMASIIASCLAIDGVEIPEGIAVDRRIEITKDIKRAVQSLNRFRRELETA